jgi:hypothetical protein
MYFCCTGMVLGHGNFGRVVKAEAIGIVEHVDVLSVAVKMVKGMQAYFKTFIYFH